MLNGCYLLPGAEFYVAIDNKGNWPNLTLLPNGEIVAAVYNHPSHGFGCGEIELWVSVDRGRIWTYRSTVSDHSNDPEVVRMNHAVGLNARGELVALVSGWSKGRQPPTLPVQVCISTDNGCTWTRHEIDNHLMPFSDIILSPDGTLTCAMHDDFEKTSCICKSEDHGQSWPRIAILAQPGDETALLRCRNGKWLAAMRTWPKTPGTLFPSDDGVQLFTSTDEGQTWGNRKTVSLPQQAPANLFELNDGKILLSYGTRIPGMFGTVVRVSEDEGDTWSPACTLISIPAASDCGYPASVQLEDGTIVTACYFGPKLNPIQMPAAPPWHWRYHTAVARWKLEHLDPIINPIPPRELLPPQRELRRYPCFRLTREPALDGKTEDDPAWETIPETSGFMVFGTRNEEVAEKQTYAQVACTDDALFVGIRCDEPEMEKLCSEKKDGEKLFDEDVVEILLQPEEGGDYHHLVVNAAGSRWNSICTGSEKNWGKTSLGNWSAAAHKGPDYWSVVLKIPFEFLGKTPGVNEEWHVNFCRGTRISTPRSTLWSFDGTFSVTYGFEDSRFFGKIIFHDKSLSVEEAKKISAELVHARAME